MTHTPAIAPISPLVRSYADALSALSAARSAARAVESKPVADGTVRTFKARRTVRDVNGQPKVDEAGNVVREIRELTVPVGVSARYRKAIRNRRAAARRVAKLEARWSLAMAKLSPDRAKAKVSALLAATK